jgi:hypothetical protein
MIFLTLMFAGALAGIAVASIGHHRVSNADAAMRGAAGAFFAGGLAVGVVPGDIGAVHPLVLAAGIAGAAVLELGLRRLERPSVTRRG